MSKEIYEVIHSVWRNHPKYPSTFSNCECGRGARRGSEPCLKCLADILKKMGVSIIDIADWYELIIKLRQMEMKIVGIVEHDGYKKV